MQFEIQTISEKDPQWKELYENSSELHFFQSPQWAELLTKHLPGMISAHIKIKWNDQVFIIPMIRIKKFFGLFSSCMSLPLGTTGGILSNAPISSEIIAQLISYLKNQLPMKIVISCHNNELLELLHPFGSIYHINALTLKLDRPYDKIEKDLFSKNKRKLVNRGRRRGVVIKNGKDQTIIDSYIKLQKKVELQKGWATKFPESFTRGMLYLKESDLWTAWIDSQLASAIVCFAHNGIVTAWQGILDRDLNECLTAQPMNLLYASMIQYYQENGYNLFDMGHSLNISSLEQYKKGFGCQETDLYYFIWKSSLFKVLKLFASLFTIRHKIIMPKKRNTSD